METIDDLVLLTICKYLNDTSCKTATINNMLVTSHDLRKRILKNITIKKHRVVHFVKKSNIKWTMNPLCLKCNRINEQDLMELVRIRNEFSNVSNKQSVGRGIFIHRDTQSELETFLVKLMSVTKNVYITRNVCCDGKGVEIDLQYK